MIDDATNRRLVRKSYELITAKNKWSEIESKLLATFIKELNPKSEDDFRELNISIDSIQKLWGVKVDTPHIRNLCLELQQKAYELPQYAIKENGKPDYEKIKSYKYVSLFNEIEYHLNEKYITFDFHNRMKPHLLEFTRFIKYRIENILQFKNRYSISFYELFKAQEFKKEKIKKIVLEIDYIHNWLDTPKSYKETYGNLKKKILTPVMLDLQKFTDIYVTFKEIKTGRKVTNIEFSLTQNVSKEEKNQLFDDLNLDKSYEKYIGKDCVYNGVYFENLKLITPCEEFYKVEFANGNIIKFKNLKDLESIIMED